MCAAKDYMADKTFETGTDGVEFTVRNLEVIKLMQSLRSRGYVRETFNWQWYYWYLTNEGIEYLRDYLHLPIEIVPATLKKQAARPARPSAPAPRGRMDKDKRMGPSDDFNPEYRREGGFGRGAGPDGYRREGGFGGRGAGEN